jgi:DNA helicase-2/ATP-dependent DNA helicase PcrA
LVIAGAGSGKTEVMARRVAWWVAVEGVPKDAVAAFTFTERAAEEMKFRIRKHIARVTPPGEDSTLGGMYVGTIHAFCLKMLRELRPDVYYNFEVLDDVARLALVERGYYGLLGLTRLQSAWRKSKYETIGEFLKAYDLLNEYGELEVELPSETAPADPAGEGDWCRSARLLTDVGSENVARAFAESAARYYAYLRCRRFLDFSTSQSELLRLLRMDAAALETVRSRLTHVVVDEAQDLNPVQDELVRTIMGDGGTLTAVGDHRQAIYAWRGARVDLMAALYEELRAADDGDVVELEENFRSTPRIIELANRWADTIPPVRTLGNPEMRAGNDRRADLNPTHVAVVNFETRLQEAEWIAEKIATLVRRDGTGTFHDTRDGERGISYGDVAVLVRSSTDSRTYMEALERRGIPAVVRAGPDLFSQPEVLLFVAAFARAVGITEFFGSRHDPKSLPARIHSVFGCAPEPEPVLRKACAALRAAGLPLDVDLEDRLLLSADLMGRKLLLLDGPPPDGMEAKQLKSARLRDWLSDGSVVRRVFPQTLYHLLLEEAGVGGWETLPRGRMAMFHLGQLSSIIKGIETPGWTNPQDFKYQIIALCQSAARDARTEEAPLLVPPDAVTIATIHSVKGLEYAAVFLADVCPSRFPSSKARSVPELPFGGPILQRINPNRLADDENHDGERRLMYVALTRAERYLFVTCSGSRRSRFFREVEELVRRVGGTVGERDVPRGLRYLPSEIRREFRLTTSFTDLCYYLRCPHDFYLRKVLGFAPTISQAFGYGRGIHNLLREVHADPRKWARLARDPETLAAEVWGLIARGLFYLRYTTGEPAENMRRKAVGIVADYVRSYRKELARLEFVPEREFETLVEEEQVLISGAVDLVRLDDPPRVTLIDFKSGHAESDAALNLQEEEMRLQLAIYGLAARRELEYEPERGLVRYLGETDPARRELAVMLDDAALDGARRLIVDTVREIKRRNFESGPRNGDAAARCAECDFRGICGRAVRRHRRPRTRRRR